MVRLIFIAVADLAGAPGGVRPRVLRGVALAPQIGWRGLVPVRYPPARRMLQLHLADPLPMRSAWLKPAREILEGARWSEWCSLGGFGGGAWPEPRWSVSGNAGA